VALEGMLFMIIVRLMGGLGNQMFQYAAAKTVALRLNVELLLDIGAYNKITEALGRFFALDFFKNINEKVASTSDVMKLYPWLAIHNRLRGTSASMTKQVLSLALRGCFYCLNLLPKSFGKAAFLTPLKNDKPLAPIRFSRVYFQGEEPYNHKFNSISDNTYMIGHWESEKFFYSVKTQIKSIYSFDNSFYELPLWGKLYSEQSVSIHIRRGDKIRHATCLPSDMAYILSAVQIIKSKINAPVFYVFSDDIGWCKENLPNLLKERLHFVENHDNKGLYRDMFLMSQCKHNIIAPSTFSWWAAWLNPHLEKIIIAPHPKLWGKDTSGFMDFLPSEWIALK
jgi:hypothetical protein